MKIKYLIILTLAVLAASGCASDDQFIKGRKIVSISRQDLDNDGVEEIILAEDKSGTGLDVSIEIKRPKSKQKEVDSFSVPGRFRRIELIDLSAGGYKEIAVYYDGKDKFANLVIYNFKNEKLSKVFEVSSPCGVEADFSSVLGRVRVGKPASGYRDCSSRNTTDWDIWVWSGEKFIREYR